MVLDPPLGDYPTETRHLNLQWTVGDVDRMEFIRTHRALTLTEIDDALVRRGLVTSRKRLIELSMSCGIQLREVARP